MLPKTHIIKMDQICRRFLWGTPEDTAHHFYPAAWANLCNPLCAGGLGTRNLEDVNRALVTKATWTLCSEVHKPWVKLIKAKYLRGRKLLDVQGTEKAVSWVWGSIKQCLPFLRKGTCFQVATNSRIRIKEDPWLASSPEFRVPATVDIPPYLYFVRHLMTEDGTAWNVPKVTTLFPPSICHQILQTPILEQGRDRLVWLPSTSGLFSTKSAYKLLTQIRGCNPTDFDKNKWRMVWKAEVHGRHKLFLWKVLHKALPTLDKLARVTPLVNDRCYLCHNDHEDVDHLFMECPVSKLLWWNSPWQIKLERFSHIGLTQWILQILGNNHNLPIPDDEQVFLKHFLCTVLELTWASRNKCWKDGIPPDPHTLSQQVNSTARRYWLTVHHCRKESLASRTHHQPVPWHPPPRGEFKLNFDAAFFNGITHTGVVLQNDGGVVLGAWTDCFRSENPFCAETEAAVQALKIAHSFHLERVTIEGDALNVILALSGVPEAEDWKAKKALIDGRRLVESHLFWSLNFTPRSGNFVAHNLARWASRSLFCGQVDLTTLPPSVLEDEIT